MIRVAQIGVGHDHAVDAMLTLQLQKDLYEVVGYAIVPEDAGNAQGFLYENKEWAFENIPCMTVDEILNYPGLDAVVIETEDRALTKYALMAAEKGLNIHMDKPGGVDGDEFNELIDMVKEKQLIFHTGYMYRYNPEIIKLKEDIKDGKLGEVYAVEAQMNCLHGIPKRNWLENYPGGMLYYLGCHLIDLVYSIMGEPEAVIPLSTASGTDGVAAEDVGMVVFKYKNGVSFAKSTAVEYGGFQRRQLVVCGSKGTVEMKPIECLMPQVQEVRALQTTTIREVYTDGWFDDGNTRTTEAYGRYDAMFRAFAAYVNGEMKNPYDYEYERRVHKLVLESCGA